MSNKDENILFKFTSLDKKEKDVNLNILLDTVHDGILIILNQEFSEQGKREIKPHQDRLQFACPYCRDSATDSWKKRGNLYIEDQNYHCYNCGIHTTSLEFLKDFGIDLDNDSMIALHNISKNAKKNFQNHIGNLSDLYIFYKYIEFAQDLEDYKKLFGLKNIDQSVNRIREYLNMRDLENEWFRMALDADAEQLYIFNMVDDKKSFADDIIIEDSENFFSGGGKGIDIKQIVLSKFNKALDEGGKEMSKGGIQRKLINGVWMDIEVPNQREIFMNAVNMLEIIFTLAVLIYFHFESLCQQFTFHRNETNKIYHWWRAGENTGILLDY